MNKEQMSGFHECLKMLQRSAKFREQPAHVQGLAVEAVLRRGENVSAEGAIDLGRERLKEIQSAAGLLKDGIWRA